MTGTDEVRDAPEAIDELEAESISRIQNDAAALRRDDDYVFATPEGRANLERAFAAVLANARALFDDLRIKTGSVRVH